MRATFPEVLNKKTGSLTGFTLIDVVVGIALLLIFFMGLFGLLRASLLVSSLAKAEQDATAIAQTQMEYLRGLTYDSLGTVNGIPAGEVPQYATTTENGLTYVTHTFISYVDDPADGIGVNDANGIITDYKQARVETTYTLSTKKKSVVLDSWFAPPGLETSNGGGTLLIKVVDATGAPLSGASVQITNASTSPTINVTTASNTDGQVYLPGAATSSSYQIHVTKSGYSSAQTYPRDAVNQNPNPGYLTVVKDQTTASTFAIDRISHLGITTYTPIATSTFSDSFSDASHLARMSSTTVSSGALSLAAGETTGSALSIATTSSYLVSWGTASATMVANTNSSVRLHIYDGSGNLIPDSVLSGNSAGFATSPIALESLSTTTYPALAIGATLKGTATSTPSISSWALSYTSGPTPLPNVAFTVTGTKTIGSKGDGTPLYKTIVNSATDANGTQLLNLEWDSYTMSLPGYDVEEACPASPYPLAPNTTVNTTLLLGAPTANYLRVSVTDNTGAPVSGAQVTLSKSGYTKTNLTSALCGSTYFGGVANSSTYSVKIAKAGYTTTTFTGLTVSGASTYTASFP